MMSMSIATMLTFTGGIWMASQFIQTQLTLIDDAIAAGKVNKTELTEHALNHARKYRLMIKAHLREFPEDEGAMKDLGEVEDDIDDLKVVLDCLKHPDKKNC